MDKNIAIERLRMVQRSEAEEESTASIYKKPTREREKGVDFGGRFDSSCSQWACDGAIRRRRICRLAKVGAALMHLCIRIFRRCKKSPCRPRARRRCRGKAFLQPRARARGRGENEPHRRRRGSRRSAARVKLLWNNNTVGSRTSGAQPREKI